MEELKVFKAIDIGYKGTHKYTRHKCIACGKERWAQLCKGGVVGHFYCHSCCQIGDRCCNWKGGRRENKRGYAEIFTKKDDFFFPMACQKKGGKSGYILEHRLVMAKHLNRCLLPWEIVHHKNGVRKDNRLENLELLPHPRFHLVETATKSYIMALERKIVSLEKELEYYRNKRD